MRTSKAIQTLMDEHAVIEKACGKIAGLEGLWETDKPGFECRVLELLHFFREYADCCHHAKEDNELFDALCKANELLRDGIVQELAWQHEDFREVLKNIEQQLGNGAHSEAFNALLHYREELLTHIAAEDDELFPMADNLLSEEEKERLYFRFTDLDRELGTEVKKELTEWLK